MTYYLLDYLREAKEPVTTGGLIGHLRTKVSAWSLQTGLTQTPWLIGEASLVFASPIPEPQPPAVEAVGHGQILFSDEFSRSLNKAIWVKGAGRWRRRADGTLEGKRHHQDVAIWIRQIVTGDYQIDFDVEISEDGHGGFSVLLNGLGKGNAFDTYYHVGIGHRENHETVIQRMGKTVAIDKVNLVEFGRWYHLTVTMKDGHMAVLLDGKQIMEYADASPLVGSNHQYVAIGGSWATDTTLIFDNVVIKQLKLSQ